MFVEKMLSAKIFILLLKMYNGKKVLKGRRLLTQLVLTALSNINVTYVF